MEFEVHVGWFEVGDLVFEGWADFGVVRAEDAEGDLVPDDLPVGMSMQEMVMPAAQQDAVRVTRFTAVLGVLDSLCEVSRP